MQVKFMCNGCIALCVPMHVLPWPQHKTWMPNGSRGCIHTHWKKPTMKDVGIPIHMQRQTKLGKNRFSYEPCSQIKAWTWKDKCLMNIMCLMKVCWYKCYEMQSWSWSNYLPYDLQPSSNIEWLKYYKMNRYNVHGVATSSYATTTKTWLEPMETKVLFSIPTSIIWCTNTNIYILYVCIDVHIYT